MEELRAYTSYGNIHVSTYNALLKERKSLEMYEKLWRKRVWDCIEGLAQFEASPISFRSHMYRICGFFDVCFTKDLRYHVYLKVQIEQYRRMYPKLKAELQLKILTLENDIRTGGHS